MAEHKGFKAFDMKGILEVANDYQGHFLEAWDEFRKSVS